MHFNNVGGDGLIQRCETRAGLGPTGISSDANLLIQFTGHLNDALSKAITRIKRVDKNNRWDDFNYADYPDAPITMVAGQADYTIPVAATGAAANTNIGINGIYFRESDGSRTYLSQMNNEDTLNSTSGTPSKYRIQGKSTFFNVPFSSAALTKYSSTFYVEFQRSPDYFTTADTTQEPGFLVTHHYILVPDAVASYFAPFDEKRAARLDLLNEFELGLQSLEIATANFLYTTPRRLSPKMESNK